MVTQQEFTFRGKTLEELQKMDAKEFAKLLSARQRRTMKRGLLERSKSFLSKIKKARTGQYKKPIKTQLRDFIVLPEMVGLTLYIHNGRSFNPVLIKEEMIGHFLGEFTFTRSKIEHSAPGIGATKSSTAIATKAK